ncbi:hypothetical protein K491DRAFT_608700 [Lophiostoma macrostomum CBS 122681]|uniref:PSI domain-containing protein n=1 Tax=Lophiostoma macrostomum CBS 122681 TaxID=1314788 RepID=A0A6A6SV63_9PLEO|nr:hypothetical protein K491DRAFT_608700 [Lophiostoma macrostomum CBS 122681]
MSYNCPSTSSSYASSLALSSSSFSSNAGFNVSGVFEQRWHDGTDEDRERLEECWRYTFRDCGDCQRSKAGCGWCPVSSTCLPLPRDPLSRAFPLLSPIRYRFICALGPERFELRTSGLGCQVSTITFLTSIVTIFCTIGGLIVLYGLIKLVQGIAFAARARKGGWVVNGDGSEDVWIRRGESWGKWWRRVRGREREEEILMIDGGTSERSWWTWRIVFQKKRIALGGSDERRALLQ